MNYDTDVLVVGAGPTGLSLAAGLQKLGVGLRIIEQKPTLSDTTKATNLMQGTQEGLAGYGLMKPMLETGGKMRRLMVHGYGANFSPRTMRLTNSVFQDVLLLGQDRIEALLAQTLTEREVAIEFGTKLVKLEQNDECVKAEVEKDGTSETVTARYVVGCDGPWSATRTFTRCDFTPVKTGKAIRQIDVKLSWKRLNSMEQMWLFYFDAGFAVVVPLLDGYSRVLTIEPKENMPPRNPTLAELREKLIAVTGDDSIVMNEPKWFSYTELSMGIAPALRDKRILLAGDAGNPILPNGGQGLNTGIQDSLNLCWKLAAVVHGKANDKLLDTYQTERLKLRRGLEKVQFNSLKYTTETNGLTRFLIRRLGNLLLDNGGENQMAKAFSQINVHYRQSALTVNALKSGAVKAGERTPNAEVVAAKTSKDVSLFDLFSTPAWKLVCFNLQEQDTADLHEKASQIIRKLDAELFIITTKSGNHSATNALYYDLDAIAHKIYGIKTPTVFLIRPDRFVAVKISKQNWPVLDEYISDWFG